ncbi:MAG: NUDIX domain-containing protein [Candidatus Taylorbacteria bacterium]|nr:NUDIX domain-containing protein [Candidatus Taylorbacteria bacterium]
MITATVAFFIRGKAKNREVLLGTKTKKVCRNKRIGPGGKREKGETYKDCAAREIKEEVSVRVEKKDLKKVACVDFLDKQPDGSFGNGQRVIFFLVFRWAGVFNSNGDLRDLKWFRLNRVPFERMMLGHPLWFKIALSGNYYIRGRINYGKGRKRVESFELKARKLA